MCTDDENCVKRDRKTITKAICLFYNKMIRIYMSLLEAGEEQYNM